MTKDELYEMAKKIEEKERGQKNKEESEIEKN